MSGTPSPLSVGHGRDHRGPAATKFARAVPEDIGKGIPSLLAAAAVWVEPGTSVPDCRDPKDNKHLELTLATGANVIVASAQDLLALDPWRGTGILRPRDFLTAIGE